MKLLIFSIITLVPLNVLSSKCQNLEKKCIKLCCGKSEMYNPDLRKCEDMANTAASIVSWSAILSDDNSISEQIAEKLALVEYGPCIWEFDFITSDPNFNCYSPYYHNETSRFILKQFSMVPCARAQNTSERKSKSKLKTVFGILLVNLIPFCLPALTFYCTCIRKTNRDIEFDLVLWYLTSLVSYPLNLFFALSIYGIAEELIYDSLKYWDLLSQIFLTSTFLWPNAIGFEIWKRFKETSAGHIVAADRKRLVWYFVFVWAVTLMIVLIGVLISRMQWSSMPEQGPGLVISIISLLHFITLSVKMFVSGNKVTKVANAKLRICLISKVILRLCFMMAIPRMCCVILELFQVISSSLRLMVVLLEPFSICIFYMLKRFI